MLKLIIILVIIFAVSFGITLIKDEAKIYQGEESIMCEKAYGDMVFLVNNNESIRIKQNGDFLVNGKFTSNDIKIYEGFREYFTENKGDLRIIK